MNECPEGTAGSLKEELRTESDARRDGDVARCRARPVTPDRALQKLAQLSHSKV